MAVLRKVPIRRLRWKDLIKKDDAFLIARTTLQGRNPDRRHTHDFCEFFLVESGYGLHEVNGRTQELLPGHLVFIRAQDTHAMQGHGRDSVTFINVAVKPGLAEAVAARLGGIARKALGPRSDALPFLLLLSSAGRRQMDAAVDHLTTSQRDHLTAECFLLTALQIAQEGLAYAGSAPLAPAWLAAAIQIIKEPKIFQQGVAGFVKAAGRSPEHVAREMRRHYQMSPGELVAETRLAHAARRLELSDISITDLAFECGFESLSHFVRLFHQRYGEPPLRYRRRRWGVLPGTSKNSNKIAQQGKIKSTR